MPNEKEEQEHPTEKKVMEYHEQVDAFTFDLENLVERYHNEFDLTIETMVGCLECTKVSLAQPLIVDLGAELLDEEEG